MVTGLGNRLNFSQRLFIWLLGYSLLLSGGFIAFQYHREKEYKSAELNARLQSINAEILSQMRNTDTIPLIEKDYPDLRVSIISPEGKVIYDTSLGSNLASNHLDREEISEAISKGEGYTVRRLSESTGQEYFYSATRAQNGYIVRTALPYSVSLSQILKADMSFLWLMGGLTLFMGLIGYFSTRRVGENVKRLNKFAECAEKGERIYEFEPFPNDELGSISNHIVRLYADLQRALTERDKEHRTALFEEQEKERIKKQLTNNINHELKTPVASICACLEILQNHPEINEKKRNDFLSRCDANAQRLAHLLNDVSQITRMADAPESIQKEKIDLAQIISETIEDCELLAESKNIRIIKEIPESIPFFGNRFLLTSVFRNLLDNAIAYSGGTEVKILVVSHTTKELIISFYDNGSGVPEEHLPHLFERFYRIDKGRSRALGGTGLGLSIVKNAVVIHNGTISVENQKSGGLRFTLLFNLFDDVAGVADGDGV